MNLVSICGQHRLCSDNLRGWRVKKSGDEGWAHFYWAGIPTLSKRSNPTRESVTMDPQIVPIEPHPPVSTATTAATHTDITRCLQAVAMHFDVHPDTIVNSVSRGGAKGVLLHRHVAIYLMRKDFNVKLDVIATNLKRTRTTIIRTIRAVDAKLSQGSRRYQDAITAIRNNMSMND